MAGISNRNEEPTSASGVVAGAAATRPARRGGRFAGGTAASNVAASSSAGGEGVTPDDARFMRRACALARRGAGWTNPNPLVGCVIVRDGAIIGEGWHERCGQAHAERNALESCARRAGFAAKSHAHEGDAANQARSAAAGATAGKQATPAGNAADPALGAATGATAYVTLEPCCHTGKQPPCTEALIAAGIARVVMGSRDPNPLVAGKGTAQLRAAGIHVDEDVLREECDALNSVFFHHITSGMPYVVAKWAMSADGKIACASGDARWVSGPAARADGHELRHRLAAILAGINTVLADDPLLTCRRDEAAPSHQPVRIVLDSQLRIPADSRIVKSAAAGEAPLIVATCTTAPEKVSALEAAGTEVWQLPADDVGRVALRPLLHALGERGIDSVLVEGGSGVHASFFAEGLVNEAVIYLAPKVIGGADAPTPAGGVGAEHMSQAAALGEAHVSLLSPDVKLVFTRDGHPGVAEQTASSPSEPEGGSACSPES